MVLEVGLDSKNESVKKDLLKVMVHHSERSCNYAKGRFDRRELPILSVVLSLRYTLDYIIFVAKMGLYL